MGKYFLNRKHKEGCAGADNAYNRVPRVSQIPTQILQGLPKTSTRGIKTEKWRKRTSLCRMEFPTRQRHFFLVTSQLIIFFHLEHL